MTLPSQEVLIERLRSAAQSHRMFPAARAILEAAADEAAREGSPFWKALAGVWKDRVFIDLSEPARLVLAAVHDSALADPASEVARRLPSCGGAVDGSLVSTVRAFLSAAPPAFREALSTRSLYNFMPSAAPFWQAAAGLCFGVRDMPFYLIEVECCGGLNLLGDLLSPQEVLDPGLVLARIGTNSVAVDLSEEAERRWTAACLLPDNPQAGSQVESAYRLLTSRLEKDENFLQLLVCEGRLAPGTLSRSIPPEPDTGCLVLDLARVSRMDVAAREAYRADMEALLRSWEGRAVWLEAAFSHRESTSRIEMRLHRWEEGLVSETFASLDGSSGTLALPQDAQIARLAGDLK